MALSQGVPFFMAGDEILRSKSADRNSYNSGDWFNRIDWTLKSNNWGVGLPPAQGNQDDWSIIGPALADPNLKPTAKDIEGTYRHMLEMLVIRKTSGLFRLRTAEEIKKAGASSTRDRTRFRAHRRAHPEHRQVLFPRIRSRGGGQCHTADAKASPTPRSSGSRYCFIRSGLLAAIPWCVRRNSSSRTGKFTVPPRTTAVFIEPCFGRRAR